MLFKTFKDIPKIPKGLPTFKCMLLGDAFVGKSSYVTRIKTGEFLSKYDKTKGVAIVPLVFHTDRGSICLNVWDVGDGGISLNEYYSSDCIIVMCDISNHLGKYLVQGVRDGLKNANCGIPTVLVGNKKDEVESGLLVDNSSIVPYCEMTVKGNRNIVEPFLLLVRKLLGDNKLQFVHEFAPWPKEPSMKKNQLQPRLPFTAYTSPLPKEDDNW